MSEPRGGRATGASRSELKGNCQATIVLLPFSHYDTITESNVELCGLPVRSPPFCTHRCSRARTHATSTSACRSAGRKLSKISGALHLIAGWGLTQFGDNGFNQSVPKEVEDFRRETVITSLQPVKSGSAFFLQNVNLEPQQLLDQQQSCL